MVAAQCQPQSPGKQHQLVNTKGSPCPGRAGQLPTCVSLKPLQKILNSEHPFIPNTKNIKKVIISHEREALRDYEQLLCSPPYTCTIIICYVCISPSPPPGLVYFWTPMVRTQVLSELINFWQYISRSVKQ